MMYTMTRNFSLKFGHNGWMHGWMHGWCGRAKLDWTKLRTWIVGCGKRSSILDLVFALAPTS
jgi:hypothetical protein